MIGGTALRGPRFVCGDDALVNSGDAERRIGLEPALELGEGVRGETQVGVELGHDIPGDVHLLDSPAEGFELGGSRKPIASSWAARATQHRNGRAALSAHSRNAAPRSP